MAKSKKEVFFVHLFCSFVLICLVLSVGFISHFLAKQKVVSVSNNEYNGTIFAGDRSSKNISLMINVYWGNEHLETMLDTLKEKQVKTTFFVGGHWAKENPDLLKRIYNEGHEIANHGTNHKEHGKIAYDKNLSEIQTCHEIVKHILGVEMNLFAPPGGSYSKNTTTAANFLEYKTIMWTRDTIDWRDKNEELIYQRAVSNLTGGDLILMHPTECTAKALPKIIDKAKSLGLSVSSVSSVIGDG